MQGLSRRSRKPFVAVVVGCVVASMGLAACRRGDEGKAKTKTTSTKPRTTGTSEIRNIELRPDLIKRKARLYVPASLPTDKPVPLVVVMHGGFGDAKGAAEQTGFDKQAEHDGFLVVYPQGVTRSFNAGGCCGPAMRRHVDDVAFIDELLDKLESQYTIDKFRVYATGMSNGALMSYRLACELPSRFAAIAPVAGTLFVGCNSVTPVSVLHIHGVDDGNAPLKGGIGANEFQHPPISMPPVKDGLETFRTIDGCPPDPSVVKEGLVTTTTSSPCKRGTAVELITVDEAGHQWPGGEQMSSILDKPTTALDATPTIWKFFKAHPKPR